MADHLPECEATDCGCAPVEECGNNCIHNCICDRLRKAEQRVHDEDEEVITVTARNYLTAGYKDGVKAARDAVAAHIRADLTGQEMFCGRKRGILAAIDALTTRDEGRNTG